MHVDKGMFKVITDLLSSDIYAIDLTVKVITQRFHDETRGSRKHRKKVKF